MTRIPWLQEYCCSFLAGGSQWIPWELYEMNCDPKMAVEEEPRGEGLYAGWDVARSRDLSVVWFNELVGDVTHTRGILVMKKTPTPDQTDRVASLMPRVWQRPPPDSPYNRLAGWGGVVGKPITAGLLKMVI